MYKLPETPKDVALNDNNNHLIILSTNFILFKTQKLNYHSQKEVDTTINYIAKLINKFTNK